MLIIDNKTISKPIYDILLDIKSKLHNGKLRDIKRKGDNIRCTCPFHKDGLENRPSCDIYVGNSDSVEYGFFNCFTCGEKGSFYKFVAECFDQTEDYAKKWLINNYADGLVEYELELDPPITLSSNMKEKYLDESILDNFKDYHPYMDKRKLSRKVCETFKIKYDPESKCIVFPVWDDKGNLVMLTRRSVESKKFIIDAGKEKPVYLLNYIKEHNIREATIFESQINALTAWGWNIPAIATFGCNVTPKQADMINKSGIEHLYICYDGDDAGIHGTKKLLKMLNKSIIVDIILMIQGKDANDLSEEEFDKLKIVDSNYFLSLYK